MERWEQSPLARRLKAADVINRGMMFAAVLLLCFVPFLLGLQTLIGRNNASAFIKRYGLTGDAAHAVRAALTAPASASAAISGVSWVFFIFGGIAAAAAIQELYQRVFEVEGRGIRHTPIRVVWLAAAIGAAALTEWSQPAASSVGGPVLVGLVALVGATAFWWFSMWLLLAGRLGWWELFPSALATGICWLGMVIVFRLTLSSTITSDYNKYGSIGVVFAIMTLLIAIGVVIILGALVGVVWRERHARGSDLGSVPMTISTRFTELVGCEVPIQQAGMGTASTPELATAVSNAGGLGMLTAATYDLAADIETTAAAVADRPFGVNFLMPFFDRAVLEAVADRARLVEWFWGEPDAVLVSVAHDAGALAAWQVGSRDEAVAAADAGCDLIIAQGVEAGGHVRGSIGLLPLLDSVLDAVRVPVIAAGGIATGRAVAAVIAAGAAAARVGTRFVATPESGAHPGYKQALVSAEAADTVLTRTFGVWWPDAPHRVLRSAVEAAEALEDEHAGEVSGAGEPMAIPRFAVQPPGRETRGHIEAMALYAGQSVTAVTAITPAAEVVRELATDAERHLRAAAG
jgi:NAD(P)H-dependent flavin oxidoreductase YrpB (nitropropane dioxygenase family)/uncharacterized BrkB/YihY/UPF0761 family membrane protein